MRGASQVGCVRGYTAAYLKVIVGDHGSVKLAAILETKLSKHEGQYYVANTFTDILASIGERIEALWLSAPTREYKTKPPGRLVSQRSAAIVERPYFCGKKEYLSKPRILFEDLHVIARLVSDADVVLVRANSNVALPALVLSLLMRTPRVLFVPSNLVVSYKSAQMTDGGIRTVVGSTVVRLYQCVLTLLSKYALTITVGSELYQVYSRGGQTDTENIVISPVERNVIESYASYERDDRRWNSGKLRLLYVGRLSKEKGVAYLIESIRHLRLAGYRVCLDILGTGPQRKRLQKISHDEAVRDKIEFHGYISGAHLEEFYRSSDILVVPGLSEGVPKVVLEAMARKILVVATQVGGIPDIVDDRETGLLVPPGDSHAIFEAISLLANERALRAEIAEQAFRFVERYTRERTEREITGSIRRYYAQSRM